MTEAVPRVSDVGIDPPLDGEPLEQRVLVKWYEFARAALAANRPLNLGSPEIGAARGIDLSSGEAAALRDVGAFKGHHAGQAGEDPLLKSRAEYLALLADSLSSAEAAKLLGVDVSRIRQRLRERSLFGMEHEGNWRLPRFQFERRVAIPGLGRVLKALPSDLFPLDLVDWFVIPDPDLYRDGDAGPSSPRAWLLAGRPIETVVAVAGQIDRD